MARRFTRLKPRRWVPPTRWATGPCAAEDMTSALRLAGRQIHRKSTGDATDEWDKYG